MRISDWSSDVCSSDRDLGPIDILVNNAGAHLKKEAQQTSDDEFLQVINTNLLSVFSLTRSCADYMIRRQRGCILMISSMTALFGMDRVVAYGTSKAALTGMIRNLVCEYSLHNVRIKAVRSEEHTSELQSLMRTSYDVFCLKKK